MAGWGLGALVPGPAWPVARPGHGDHCMGGVPQPGAAGNVPGTAPDDLFPYPESRELVSQRRQFVIHRGRFPSCAATGAWTGRFTTDGNRLGGAAVLELVIPCFDGGRGGCCLAVGRLSGIPVLRASRGMVGRPYWCNPVGPVTMALAGWCVGRTMAGEPLRGW